MLTIFAFLVALGLLIVVHEYGHYRVAVACGVKVLKFSIGFGRPLYSWRLKNKPTEFSIAWLPLGGYVRMLDEADGPVAPDQLHLAFNRQPLKTKIAVVAAGPLANLLLAVLLYAVVNWAGFMAPQAILAAPAADSVAYSAGLRGREVVEQAAFDQQALEPVRSFDDLQWRLTQGVLQGRDVRLQVREPGHEVASHVVLKLAALQASELDAQLYRKLGITQPWTAPEIGDIAPSGPAAQAGLRKGDLVLAVNEQIVLDSQQLRQLIRTSVHAAEQSWRVQRGDQVVALKLTPRAAHDSGVSLGKIDAYIGGAPAMVQVRYGFFEGLSKAALHTWDVSALTLQMMGKMLVGQASLKSLSGPLTIAEYAGKTASLGWVPYLLFLALISVSLGVLNLLPIPVLDGGHLMYYLWQFFTGRTVSEMWVERLQRVGLALLLTMMLVALFNDISRLLG